MSRPFSIRPIDVPGVEPRAVSGDAPLRLGRDPGVDMVVPGDRFPHVSAQHARVLLVDGKPVVEDLGSKNGTLVNGQRVDRRALRDGDVVQLGDLGPRFLATDRAGAVETATVSLPAPRSSGGVTRMLAKSAILRVRSALGIDHEIREAQARSRRQLLLVILFVGMVATGAVFGYFHLKGQSEERGGRLAALEEQLAEDRELARELDEERDRRIAEARRSIERQAERLADQRRTLDAERAALRDRIQVLEEGGRASSEELESLRAELTTTSDRLALYDPVNLEQRRLDEVQRVHETIVLVEVDLVYHEEKSGKVLYLERNEATGRLVANLEGRGAPYKRESTGSGFCVSNEGWILTCGHVVEPSGFDQKVRFGGGEGEPLVLVPKRDVRVVFSDTDVRHDAEVHAVAFDDEDDLAVLRIDAFDGMPHLTEFTTDPDTPDPGSDVYLFGFPLGKRVIQEGDRVIASTFRGILSRRVGNFLQIDAAVHPGNSGGPLTDEQGRVLGIVSRVQANPVDGAIVADIGYVIPIQRAAKVWPPGP